MDEILKLQEMFAEVQNTSTASKLAERNVVEILEKLKKFYGLDIIYTQDGSEFMTKDYLDKMVSELVEQMGRVQIGELPRLTGVSLDRIEQRLPSILRKYPVHNIESNLIASQYLDSIASEMNNELMRNDSLSFSEMSIKYNFPPGFLKGFVEDRLGTIIQGIISFDKSGIVTEGYRTIQDARIRGILNACIRPVSLSALGTSYNIPESQFLRVVNEMLEKHEIEGSIKAGTYFPEKFIRNQETIARNFFNKNSFIEYSFLKKNLFIQKEKDFINRVIGQSNVVYFETCAYSREGLERLKEHITTVLADDGLIELFDFLPTCFTENDIEVMLSRDFELENIEKTESLLVSQDFLDKCSRTFKSKIKNMIFDSPQKLLESTANAQNQAKGKKKQGKGSSKKKDSFFLSREEIIKVLSEEKVMQRLVDESAEDSFFELLQPKLMEVYEQTRLELFEKKKSSSTELLQEISFKIEQITLELLITKRTVDELREKDSAIDPSHLVDRMSKMSRILLQNIIFLLCRKFSITTEKSLLAEDKLLASSGNEKSQESLQLELREKFIFLDKKALYTVIEMLPKDIGKILREMLSMTSKNASNEFLGYLEKNSQGLSLKPVVLDKKIEKQFLLSEKFLMKACYQSVQKSKDLGKRLFQLLKLFAMENGLYLSLGFSLQGIAFCLQCLERKENQGEQKSKEIEGCKKVFEFLTREGEKKHEEELEAEAFLESMAKKLKV